MLYSAHHVLRRCLRSPHAQATTDLQVSGPRSPRSSSPDRSILLLMFPDARFAPLLYKFTALDYFVIFENLIPLFGLDGSLHPRRDDRETPDLRERLTASSYQHDPLAQDPGREPSCREERTGLGAYAFAGIAFTILSVSVAIFFWEAIFGSLVSALGAADPLTPVAALLAALSPVRGPRLVPFVCSETSGSAHWGGGSGSGSRPRGASKRHS